MKYPQLVSMPSAVSDWLEEQLEARGIDAVVYTRYVLSLLYRDPIDVICPDQDLHFTQPDKEVRRSGGGRKRLRRSSGWWGHDLADADRLKRSAAVECLMSASDQKCGIESLVDELCEKLKEINSNQSANGKELLPEKKRAVSPPQDPAKRYYAAFPPLSRNSSVNSPNLINLIPKWFGSPKKRTPRKQNRSSSYEEKLHSKVELDNMKARTVGKQRYNYFTRNKKEFGYCRNVSKSMDKTENSNNWDQLYLINNNTKNKCTNTTNWSQPKEDIINFVNDNNKETTANLDSWKTLDDSLNMYDDLPVDIRELLDSPSPQEDDTVEMMNLANMRDTGNKTFIQCGTNIISSIWSNDAAMDDANRIYENTFNTALDENTSESFLDLKFSSISIDSKNNKWPTCDIIAENETNSYFENFNRSLLDADFSSWNFGTTEKFQKWSDAENEIQTNDIMRSLTMLNHSKESSFTEVIPRPGKAGLNIFGTNTVVKLMQEAALKKLESEKDEDLLHSIHSHFKPINEKSETRSGYVDGTTFIIPSNVESVSYKRSESGFFYLENEQGIGRKYMDFRRSVGSDFSLKFNICQNDKASQTDADLVETPECDKEQESFYFPGDQELLIDDGVEKCECPDKSTETFEIYGDDNVLTEIFGKYEHKCDLCNNNSSWESHWFRSKDLDKKLDKQSIRDIWSGGEVCTACMNLNNSHSSLTVLHSKLREDISQDGEQLLSDLSSIQKTYMEELPIAEVSCNITELLGIKERKRRHSSINYEGAISVQQDCFSFATRLEEDCLMNIATIPTLRSVTL